MFKAIKKLTAIKRLDNSINGNPNFPKKPSPSQLDLDGLTPSKYTNNLPG